MSSVKIDKSFLTDFFFSVLAKYLHLKAATGLVWLIICYDWFMCHFNTIICLAFKKYIIICKKSIKVAMKQI